MNLLEYLKDRYGQNEPIYAEEIQFENYSVEKIAEELANAKKRGEIKLFEPGIYYFPVKMFYGDSHLNPFQIIERRYISDGIDIYGYISGLSLQNSAGLSRQVPNALEVTTNNETAEENMVTVGSFQRVRTHKPPIKITRDNVNTLQFLDLMTHAIPARINETEMVLLKEFVRDFKINKNEVNKYTGFFPEITIYNIRESGIENEFA